MLVMRLGRPWPKRYSHGATAHLAADALLAELLRDKYLIIETPHTPLRNSSPNGSTPPIDFFNSLRSLHTGSAPALRS
jgi:hypothetical protein